MSVLCIPLWLGLVATPAPEQSDTPNPSVSAIETLMGAYHGDNKNGDWGGLDDDDDYGVISSRLNLSASAGDLRTSARVDGALFIEAPSDRYVNEARLERITLVHPLGPFEVTVGDFFRQLGRGILLSIRKQDEVGLDTSLRGGRLSLETAQQSTDLFVAWANPANLDAVSQRHVRGPQDAIAGASWEWRGAETLNLGACGMALRPHLETQPGIQDHTEGAGLYLDVPLLADIVAAYAEADVLHQVLGGTGELGFAGYATLDFLLETTTLLVEGLYLQDVGVRGSQNTALQSRFVYNRVPTLQRMEEETLDSRDVLGGRVRVGQLFEAIDLNLAVNALYNLAKYGRPDEVRQLHAWADVDLGLGDSGARLLGEGGARREDQRGHSIKEMWHVQVKLSAPIGHAMALAFSSLLERRSVVATSSAGWHRYVRGSTFLGVEKSEWGGLTFELGYDTQDPSPDVRSLFYAGILKVATSDWLELEATVGTQRGGIKCISGVCRELPAFAGARLEVVGRY